MVQQFFIRTRVCSHSIITNSSINVESIDTTGAGDIYAATFATTFFLTKELIYSANLASKIAAESTKYWGMKGIFQNLPY